MSSMSPPVRVGMLCSRIRVEEKLLLAAFEQRNIAVTRIDDDAIVLDLQRVALDVDVVLSRTLQHTRSVSILGVLADFNIPTVNHVDVVSCCGDKVRTTAALAAAGVPIPRALVAFTPEAALSAVEELGYPAVIKPAIGSWGRLIARVSDRDAAEAVLEDRATLGSAAQHVYYVQEHVAKPGRDIRSFVAGDDVICAIYRTSDHWITNTARGGVTSNCLVTDEIADLSRRAARAVGGGIVAVDLMESADAILVNEVNATMEFRNSIAVTGVDIPGRIVDYTLSAAAGIAEAVPA